MVYESTNQFRGELKQTRHTYHVCIGLMSEYYEICNRVVFNVHTFNFETNLIAGKLHSLEGLAEGIDF